MYLGQDSASYIEALQNGQFSVNVDVTGIPTPVSTFPAPITSLVPVAPPIMEGPTPEPFPWFLIIVVLLLASSSKRR